MFFPEYAQFLNEHEAFKDCSNLEFVKFMHLNALNLVMVNKCNGNHDVPSNERINKWIKSINQNDEYALHRLCSSMDPSEDTIYQMICDQDCLHAIAQKNSAGISPSEYLAANLYADVDETKLMKKFVLEKMGEIA